MKQLWHLRMVALRVSVLCATCDCAGAAATEAPTFVSQPALTAAAGGYEVRFAVDKADYAQVAVVDAAGRVVRHLAAGLLGTNAPAPFQQNALSQTIVWDGRDDRGVRCSVFSRGRP